MNAEVRYGLQKLKTAFARLQEAAQRATDDLDRDGVIKRFEFTFELFWKSAKILMEHEGFECAGPRSCIKEGARRGFLTEGEKLLDMLEDRNKTTHIYREAIAMEIFTRIKNDYVRLLADNIALFDAYIARDGESPDKDTPA